MSWFQKFLVFTMLTIFSTAGESQVVRQGVIEYATENHIDFEKMFETPDWAKN